jgi:hypothetical protein
MNFDLSKLNKLASKPTGQKTSTFNPKLFARPVCGAHGKEHASGLSLSDENADAIFFVCAAWKAQ